MKLANEPRFRVDTNGINSEHYIRAFIEIGLPNSEKRDFRMS